MGIYSYAIGNPIGAGLGTGTISTVGTALTGSGSLFTSELAAGYVITSGGVSVVILSITDNTHATLVNAPAVDFSGAAYTITAVYNLEQLQITPPKSAFKPWVESKDLGNGTARGMGRPMATWQWGFISRSQRDTLKTFCLGKSARVFIVTRQNDSSDIYTNYDAVLLWPDEEDKTAGRRLNFALQFRDLIAL